MSVVRGLLLKHHCTLWYTYSCRILFEFHLNGHAATKAKVKVPRLNGAKRGVFACRTPYRPSPIGLTLAKIESIEGKPSLLTSLSVLVCRCSHSS